MRMRLTGTQERKRHRLQKVHVYTNSSFEGNQPVNLSMNQIYRLDIYDKDVAATRRATCL